MPERCNLPIDDLVAYDDGDLPEFERDLIRQHIASCPACKSRLASLRETAATLRSAPIAVDERRLARAIAARIATDSGSPAHTIGTVVANGRIGDAPLVAAALPAYRAGQTRPRHRLRELGQFVAAGLAVFVVASLLVVLFRDTDSSTRGGRAGAGSPTSEQPAAATTDAPVRLIAWANDVYGDGAFKIVVGDSAGATPAKVMPGPFFEDMSRERSPAWSPNGSILALVTDRDGNDELYVNSGKRPGAMPGQQPSALETTGPRNITNDPGSDSDPNWSPDSRWIAFSSRRDDNLDIYLTQAGSANAIRLTTNPGTDTEPEWSPDGSRIAYRHGTSNDTYDIYVMNADGSAQHRVSSGEGVSSSPTWSPDGRFLAYTTIIYTRSDGIPDRVQTNVADLQSGQIATIADDSNPGVQNVAFAMLGADSVDWSPDGALLAFTRPVGEQYDIAVASPDGSGLTMLTNTSDRDEVAPVWSPESLQLLYVSLPHGPTDDNASPAALRRIDRSGSNDTQVAPLTVQAALESRPAWGPLASEAGEPIPDAPTPTITSVPTATSLPEPPISTLALPEPDPNVCAHSQPAFALGVFVMNADGSQQRLLVSPELYLEDLDWSPDGASLLGTTGGSIVVMSSDGADNQVIVNDNEAHFKSAVWSPDGSRIAYVRGNSSSVGTEIYSANPDGSDNRLLRSIDGEVETIAWSPDGSQIAYAGRRDEIWNIFTMAADGSDERQITSSDIGAEGPSWSADGHTIRYMTEVDQVPGAYDLDYLEIDLATGESRPIDIFARDDYAPVWSPDNTQIAFEREGDIWSMAANGSGRHNLTQYPVYSTGPTWSPDGQQIVFLSNRVSWQPASDRTGEPDQIVLRSADTTQSGGGGRWCQRTDTGMEAHDVVGVVLPAEPLALPTGATVEFVFGALGTPTAIAVDIYDLTVAEQLGQAQEGVLVPPCRFDDGCHVETITIPPSLTPSLTLDLPPGRYVLAVRVNYESTIGSGYSEQGFTIVMRDE